MNAQQLFLRYAYSCGEVQRDYFEDITPEELERIKRMAQGEEDFDEEFVKGKYPAAFERMQRKMGLISVGTEEEVDYYFLFAHNHSIEEREGQYAKLPDQICDYCKAKVVRISERVEPGPWYKIEPFNEVVHQDAVHGEFVNDAQVGDLVVIHQGVVVRKISEEYYEQLKQKHVA